MRHAAKRLKKKKPSLTFTNTKLLHSKSTYFYKQQWNSYLVPAMCASALLLGLNFAINPITGNKPEAHATINEDLGNGSTISLSILNNGTEIADDGTVSTNVDAGQISYISNLIKVTTNKIGKYYVGVQSATASSELTGADTKATIAGVGNNVTTSNFGDNTWGYVLTDNTTANDRDLAYNTLPAYSASTTPQYASSQNPDNGEHELKLTFAAKIRADKPADHYQTTALVSVAAEAKAIPSWQDHGLSTMQSMTSSICSSAEEGTTGQLTDTRDSKTYWVTKLKDGNCWMTQNLALDLSTSKALTSADSDVASSWTPPANTQQDTITSFPSSSNRYFSYNPGEYIYTTPLEQHNCGSTGITRLGDCPNWELRSSLSEDISGDEQSHYLAGNYYSYDVTTAGYSSGSGTAPNSICPKNWKLPTGNNNDAGSFATLTNGLTASVIDTANNIKLAPYHFVYGGNILQSLRETGNAGYYWSSTTFTTAAAYPMQFNSNTINSFSNLSRHIGIFVRCVAR